MKLRSIRVKRLVLMITVIALSCLTSACAGAGDWTSEPLPGNYVVVRSNSESVQLCIPDDEDDMSAVPVAGPIITHIICNDDYILLKCRKPADSIKEYFERHYYIADVKRGEIYGPLEEEQFLKQCEELGFGELDWKSVDTLKKREEPES